MKWRRFIPTSAMVLAVRLGGAGAGFLIQLMLARLLAPEALGTFFSATSLAAVLALFAAWGYPNLAPRFISRYRERNHPKLVAGFLLHAVRDIAITSLLAGSAVIAIAYFWPGTTSDNRLAFIMAGLAVPIMAIVALNAATAGAVRAFALSYVPEALLRPLLFLGVLCLFIVLKQPLTVELVIALFFGITAAIAFGQFLILRHILALGPGRRPPRLAAVWRAEALPLVVVALFTNLFADLDILMVTPFLNGADVAAFGIALKLALLVGFGVQVAHSIAAPDLADAHARRSLDQARTTLRRATIFPVVFTGLATLACAMGGEYFLALFHSDFASAKWALTILGLLPVHACGRGAKRAASHHNRCAAAQFTALLRGPRNACRRQCLACTGLWRHRRGDCRWSFMVRLADAEWPDALSPRQSAQRSRLCCELQNPSTFAGAGGMTSRLVDAGAEHIILVGHDPAGLRDLLA